MNTTDSDIPTKHSLVAPVCDTPASFKDHTYFHGVKRSYLWKVQQKVH